MEKSQHARAVYRAIEQAQSSGGDSEMVAWAVVETVASIVDNVRGVPFVGPIAGAVSAIRTAAQGSGANSLIDNPYFVGNGHGEDDPSKITQKYMKGRLAKNLGASGASIVGAVGSVWTQVDVAGIAVHGNATGCTVAHLAVLRSLSAGLRRGGTLDQWMTVLIKMKALKLTTRTASLVGSAVPIPAVGITTGLIAAAVATGTKLTMSKACLATALELHWRTRQEQFMSGVVLGKGTGGSVGPASQMVYELFTKRGITRILGKHDVDAIVHEPAGWNAIFDKLMLI